MPALQVEKQGHVWIMRMALPATMNSLEKDLVEGMLDALAKFEQDSEARVALLTGEGKAFCAGGSLGEIDALENVLQCVDYVKNIGKIIGKISQIDKPVVAYVNGFAVGAGFNLALACDLVVASSRAKFIQAFSNVGLIPDLGGLYFLPRLIGLQRAKDLIFMAREVGASEALALGLVNRVVEDEGGEAKALEFAGQLAARPGRALAFAKNILNRGWHLTLEDVLDDESVLQAICMQSQDHKEGIAAFFAKRTPQFTGK